MAIPNIEIRLLKARSKAAENCLKFLLHHQPNVDKLPVEYGSWWMPPLQQGHLQYDPFYFERQTTGLLGLIKKKNACKKLHHLDKKLAELDAIVPKEVPFFK